MLTALIILVILLGWVHAAANVVPFDYPLFKQCDTRWGSDIMEPPDTICDVGCLMSSVSMSLRGKHVSIGSQASDPSVLNTWLRANRGYTNDSSLYETVVPEINPDRIKFLGSLYNNTALPPSTLRKMLDSHVVVIANVMQGRHFVLVVGYDKNSDTKWYVNDPGFSTQFYSYEDIVGYRLFEISEG